MKEYLLENLSGSNLFQFIISAYTFGLTYVLGKVHFVYAHFIIARNKDNTLAIYLTSAFILSYLIGIPASNFFHLELGNWASYFWFFSYANVLTTNFLNSNLMKETYLKIKNICCKKENNNNSQINSFTESKTVFNMISKTTLDMMFITSIRPLILFYTKRWMGKYGNSKLFKNCEYEYDERYFKIEMFGLYSMISINFMIVSLICGYSLITKKKVLHYRDNLKIFNLYILFLMNCFYEATLTVFY